MSKGTLSAVRGSYIQGSFLKVTDPTGELNLKNPGDLDVEHPAVPFSYEHVEEAVTSARRAFPGWRRRPLPDRLTALEKYRDLLKAKREAFARTISLEVGKPLWESRREVDDCIGLINFFISDIPPALREQRVSTGTAEGSVRHFPLGVVAIVSPFNQPLYSTHAHFVPALLLGNSVVIKSSRFAPHTGQCIADAFHESGFPSGVVNVLHGDSEVSRRLVSHGEVDGILFTGSFEAGMKVKKQILSDYWKLLVLDMGSKNGCIVWEDADYPKALHETLFSAFVTTGQRPTTTDLILVHEKLFDRFLGDFHALAKKCRVGYAEDTQDGGEPFMGPLICEETLEHYLRAQGMAVREGCEEIMRGKQLDRARKGYYVSPSIHVVAKLDPKSVYQTSELLGPNVALYKIRDLDEAAEILNFSNFGLVGSLYSQNAKNLSYLVDELRVSAVHLNRPTVDMTYHLPLGGHLKSGNLRPMGSHARFQCTYPVSLLEANRTETSIPLPESMPRS